MLSLPPAVKIFLSAEPCDMRRGFDSLAAQVRAWGQDVYSGHLFVFLSRRSDQIKILVWSEGGFVMFHKRLEKGCFKRPLADKAAPTAPLTSSDLVMLLSGIDLSRVHRARLWQPPTSMVAIGGSV